MTPVTDTLMVTPEADAPAVMAPPPVVVMVAGVVAVADALILVHAGGRPPAWIIGLSLGDRSAQQRQTERQYHDLLH